MSYGPCKSCGFNYDDECHRNPPVVIFDGEDVGSFFPEAISGCGEWEDALWSGRWCSAKNDGHGGDDGGDDGDDDGEKESE